MGVKWRLAVEIIVGTMSDGHRHIDEELIAKFFSQETGEEENDLIRQWREESAANQRQFDRWALVWADTGRIAAWEEPTTLEVESALERVRLRKNEILEQQESKSPILSWMWRVAAVLVVGVGIGWLVFSNRSSEAIEFVAEADVVVSELDDGSVISLNEGSRLRITEVGKEKREVFLEGEAYFEVAPDPQRPFVVNTKEVMVEVLGTSFNVSEVSGKETLVSVEEGRVRLRIGQDELILVGGQTGSYDHFTSELKLLEIEDTGEYRFWKTKRLVFREQRLADVVDILNRTYDQQVQLSSDQVGQCLLTVSFDNASIQDILEIITITLDLRIIESGNGIVIDGEGC